MSHHMRRPLLGVAAIAIAAALSLVPEPTSARAEIDWSNKRDAARAHATAIRTAWGRLSSWIERRPRGADPDLTQIRGPHLWLFGPNSRGIRAGETFSVITVGVPPSIPPVWNPTWTDRGLAFRFCDQVLAVFAEEPKLKGADMPTVAVEGGLQVIRGTEARGTPQSGYPSVTIPACMRPLPTGHVALVATATDPFGWDSTRRRNEHHDWQINCPNPDGDPAATIGTVRYSQTRPIELHPWSGADMDRWPATCVDRDPGSFTYLGAVYGSVTEAVPAHGQCDPPGTSGTHIVDAVVNDSCRAPTLIGGRRGARWHFWDTLCLSAASGATAAIDGGASAHTAVVSEGDGSIFLKEPDYDGDPQPTDLPAIPGCDDVRPYCPGPYTSGGPVGSRTLIEKHRFIWREPCADSVCVGAGSGWEPNKRRDYTEPGGSAPTGVPGVARGDMWIRENFTGCYEAQPERVNCPCPDGHVGNGWAVFWDYHPHDGRGRVKKGETCHCTFVPTAVCADGDCSPGEDPVGFDTDGDGVADTEGSVAPSVETGFVDSIGGISITGTHSQSGTISSISISVTSGGGGGGGDGGSCFLTTAMVERRGEADDGPTLTTLREFRDRYMMASPERIAMVADYYRRAPAIVAAIPQDHPEWEWIEARIDEAVAAIRAGDDEAAFGMYVEAMRALNERWGSGG